MVCPFLLLCYDLVLNNPRISLISRLGGQHIRNHDVHKEDDVHKDTVSFWPFSTGRRNAQWLNLPGTFQSILAVSYNCVSFNFPPNCTHNVLILKFLPQPDCKMVNLELPWCKWIIQIIIFSVLWLKIETSHTAAASNMADEWVGSSAKLPVHFGPWVWTVVVWRA